MKKFKSLVCLLLTATVLMAVFGFAGWASTDELNEIAGIRTPGT